MCCKLTLSCDYVLQKRKLKEKEREREKKKKKKEKVEKRAKGPITESWGKYGIIKELDMWLVSFKALCVPPNHYSSSCTGRGHIRGFLMHYILCFSGTKGPNLVLGWQR